MGGTDIRKWPLEQLRGVFFSLALVYERGPAAASCPSFPESDRLQSAQGEGLVKPKQEVKPQQKSDAVIAQSHLELEERIRKRAHEIWLRRAGNSDSHAAALDDWLQAEQEVLGASSQPAQDRGTTVGDAHRPHDFHLGDA